MVSDDIGYFATDIGKKNFLSNLGIAKVAICRRHAGRSFENEEKKLTLEFSHEMKKKKLALAAAPRPGRARTKVEDATTANSLWERPQIVRRGQLEECEAVPSLRLGKVDDVLHRVNRSDRARGAQPRIQLKVESGGVLTSG